MNRSFMTSMFAVGMVTVFFMTSTAWGQGRNPSTQSVAEPPEPVHRGCPCGGHHPGSDDGLNPSERQQAASERALRRAAHRERVRAQLDELRSGEEHRTVIAAAQQKEQMDPVSREQRKHIHRMSRIGRLADIAAARNDEQLSRQVDIMRTNEAHRHRGAIKRLSTATPKTADLTETKAGSD